MATPPKKSSKPKPEGTVKSSDRSSSSRKASDKKSNRSKHSEVRAKTCKFLRKDVREKLKLQAETINFTTEEKAKVEALKQYFKQYWLSLTHHHKTRLQREKQTEKMLKQQTDWTKEQVEGYLTTYNKNESHLLRMRRAKMSTVDFMLLAVLGRGGFGEVYLARKGDTGEILALKKMPKKHFLQQNDLSKLKRERDVMVQNDSPWLIKLKYSFQSEEHVYLAMEFIAGGDMKNLLDHVGCFSEDHVRFYFAEMLLAVEALHKLGYIHRDLKPDNFLVDRSGHLKLIDFGLSKDGLVQKYGNTLTMISTINTKAQQTSGENTGTSSIKGRRKPRKTFSVVGSPEYMAIEILEECGYDHTVDYWSLGVIIYELFWGITPFGGENMDETFQKLSMWKEHVAPPEPLEEDEEPISEDAWNLISGLLCEPEKRLGRDSPNEIKNHSFFNSFNWDMILEKDPPFVPELDDELDTSYFVNALDEEDIEALTPIAGEILKPSDGTKLPLDQVDPTFQPSDGSAPTHFKNKYEKMAFAGWTFKHDDMQVLIQRVNDD